jgi:heavy metal translocating P-type ATPase
VAATIGVGVVATVLWLIGWTFAADVIVAVFAIGIAVSEAVRMISRLRRGVVGVDLLAVVAIVSTVLVGELVASLIIVLMLTGGEALEDFAQARAERDLTRLIDRSPRYAHRVSRPTGEVEEVAVSHVEVGDRLLVKPSEVVPVDGVLDPGTAPTEFDESSLTGESLPVAHKGGDNVLSGSVNGPTAVTMTATADAGHSQYQNIVALVNEAASHPAPVVRLADRFALPFTALALAIGAVAWLATGDPVRFAEVLVLATPCPLIIAAPIAFLAGTSRAARNGIIVKGGAALETLSRVRTVVFDKTGTLTEGRPVISRIRAANDIPHEAILRLAASAEQYSSHVLAAAVIERATRDGLALQQAESARELATAGVEARFGDEEVRVGKLAFVAERAPDARAFDLEAGEFAVYVAVDDMFAGAIIGRDALRTNARATIADLVRHGVEKIVMVTGDAPATAESIAAEAGIDDVRAGCLPADKVREVARLTPRPVVMIGDGVNDAPVLASADVGIAMGARGATAASDSADVVILADDLSKAAVAVAIGRDSVRIALQSIWIGIILSVVLMSVAAFGLIPAPLGAGVQEVVDLICILNALRALREPPGTPSPARSEQDSASVPRNANSPSPEEDR